MRISIITATFNSSNTITDCINSVNDQSYTDIEQIIIDGASTDKTLEKVNAILNRVSKIISEPDNGIYDAMNKGIENSTGEIVGILNSDDFYSNNNVISKIADVFENNELVDCVYADLFYVDQNDTNKEVRYWKTGAKKPFLKGWHPAHPTFFVRKNIYDKYGLFDLDYKLAADFELMLRLLEKEKITSYYLQEPIIKMRLGGATNKSLKNIIKGNIECYTAFKKNGLQVNYLYPLFRLIPKLRQYFIHAKR